MSRKKSITEIENQIKKLQDLKKAAIRNERKRVVEERRKVEVRRNEIIFLVMDDYLKNKGLDDEKILELGVVGIKNLIFGKPAD